MVPSSKYTARVCHFTDGAAEIQTYGRKCFLQERFFCSFTIFLQCIVYTYVSTCSADVTVRGVVVEENAEIAQYYPLEVDHDNGGQACQNRHDHVAYRLDRMNTNQRSMVKV